MQGKYKIGNAQTIGNYEIQSNYFSTLNADFAFAVLADGTIDHSNGRKAAILAVETSIAEFYNKLVRQEFSAFYDSLSIQIIKNINDKIYLGKKPNVSISIVFLERDELFYYSVGDSKIFLYDECDLIPLNARNGHCNIKKKDTVLLMSKGVYQALNEMELLELLSKEMHPYHKAQSIIEDVNNKNIKAAGNSTMILIEGGL